MLIFACLCGCSKQAYNDVLPITKGFECEFEVVDSNLSGNMFINVEGELSFIFESPDIINSMAIRIKEDSVILEVHNLSERYRRDSVPNDSPLLLIYDALLSMSCDALETTVSDSNILVMSSNQNGSYKATIDGNGFITKITFVESNTTFTFYNATRLNLLQ